MFNTKLGILIAIFTSILIFSLVILFHQYDIEDGNLTSRSKDKITPHEFYSQNFNSERKHIFILGSSQVVAINSINIQNYLKSSGYGNYDVYNLAVISDTPYSRANTIDQIISTKPILILYGVSDRDFTLINKSSVNNPLPDPHSSFKYLLKYIKQISPIDIEIFEFPQKSTLEMIISFVSFLQGDSLESISYPHTPFMKVTEAAFEINSELNYRRTGFATIPLPEENINFIALKESIQKLNSNNIEVILFAAPQSQFYSKFMPIDYENSFNLILNDLQKTTTVQVYDLFDKYAYLDIWSDLTHLSLNPRGNVYTEDITEIILKNIDQ
jgi:hypothetical protein